MIGNCLSDPVAYVLTIENFTPFLRHVREINRSNDGLILYTSGFPARPTLRQIVRLAALANLPTFHWGDIYPGGMSILEHLERALAEREIVLRPQ